MLSKLLSFAAFWLLPAYDCPARRALRAFGLEAPASAGLEALTLDGWRLAAHLDARRLTAR